ncbi:hypothetical protein PAXRUDRAFT_165043, partial [Paxillus rubicundulus Ve08.2h10]
PPCRRGQLKTEPTKPVSKPEHMDGRIDNLPAKLDAAEMVQGYWGSVPEPLDTRTQGTEACGSTVHTVNTTRSPTHRELPYWVIMLEGSTWATNTAHCCIMDTSIASHYGLEVSIHSSTGSILIGIHSSDLFLRLYHAPFEGECRNTNIRI